MLSVIVFAAVAAAEYTKPYSHTETDTHRNWITMFGLFIEICPHMRRAQQHKQQNQFPILLLQSLEIEDASYHGSVSGHKALQPSSPSAPANPKRGGKGVYFCRATCTHDWALAGCE